MEVSHWFGWSARLLLEGIASAADIFWQGKDKGQGNTANQHLPGDVDVVASGGHRHKLLQRGAGLLGVPFARASFLQGLGQGGGLLGVLGSQLLVVLHGAQRIDVARPLLQQQRHLLGSVLQDLHQLLQLPAQLWERRGKIMASSSLLVADNHCQCANGSLVSELLLP